MGAYLLLAGNQVLQKVDRHVLIVWEVCFDVYCEEVPDLSLGAKLGSECG